MFIFTPNAGYYIDSIIVDGVPQPLSPSYTFTDVQSNHTIHVTYTLGIKEFKLYQNYPNPFNLSSTISFDLPIKSCITLKVFDILGKEITNLVIGEMLAGTHSQKLNALSLSSGVYFYRLQAGSYVETKKCILLR
jgi:hypothetical protein